MNEIGFMGSIALVMGLGILAQWTAWKLRFPALIILLGLGIIVGPGIGVLNPDTVFGDNLLYFIEICVSIILFDGAIQLKKSEFAEVSAGLKRILTLGLLFNLVITFLTAHFVIGTSFGISMILSGILIVTGPSVIIPALKEINIRRRPSNFLKWEGILTDPIGALIAVLSFDFVQIELFDKKTILIVFFKLIIIAIIFAFAFSALVKVLYEKKWLPEHLLMPSVFVSVIVLFVMTNYFQSGAGLLSVTIYGLIMGNMNADFIEELRHFKEQLSTLVIGFVFIVLAASLKFEVFEVLEFKHYLFVILVAFVTRFVAIMLANYKSGVPERESILIGLYGPRGVVAAAMAGVFSKELVKAGFVEAQIILPIVFLIIIITVVVHSLYIKPLSKLLKLENESDGGVVFVGTVVWVNDLAQKLKSLGVPVLITSASWHKLALARNYGIQTYYGQILKALEHASLDTTNYKYFLAASENDSFNQLVTNKFVTLFGKHNCYHLKLHSDNIHDKYNINKQNYCIWVNSNEFLFENMLQKYHLGWSFKETKLTAEFDRGNFLIKGESYIIVLVVKKDKSIVFGSSALNEAGEGDTIVSYAPKD